MKFLVLISILSVLMQRTWGNVQGNYDSLSEEILSDIDFNVDQFERQPLEENLPYSLEDDGFQNFVPI